ncbi:conjugative transposon protein TraM [Flexithrix dorotheae]|uniref:conjugative transposon protein TraM n=1 Tax=Flexithrix dorotheae TaxID=70993 RepID=UPI00037B5D79|nr:conjugative transposon protein TraM [Flexithrix dorotheae]
MRLILQKLRSFDPVILGIIAAIPIFIYLHGYILTGPQIFSIHPDKNLPPKMVTPINIQSEESPVGADIIREEEDTRKEFVQETIEQKENYKKAVSLSEKVMAFHDINQPEEKVELAPTKDSILKIPKPQKASTPEIQKPKEHLQVQQNLKQEMVFHLQNQNTNASSLTKKPDPYAGFHLERSGSLLHKEKSSATKPKLTLEKQVVNGQFVGNKRFTVGKDQFIYLRNTESFELKTESVMVPKGTIMLGKVVVTDKVYITISSIEIAGRTIAINIMVCDHLGVEGITYSDMNETFKEVQSELDDIVEGSLDNINVSVPMVGSISLPSKIRSDHKKEIFFDSATKIKLLIKF